MSEGRRGVALTPMETRRDIIVRTAELADEFGYEVMSIAEGWAFDSLLVLAEAAARTRRIRLAAGVLSVWSRSPGAIAMGAATMHAISGGRFILGLGASTRQLVEGLHDVAYRRPAERLRHVTSSVRALLAGERARIAETRSARALRLGLPAVPDLPIWIGATGGRTAPVAAELGDGWLPIWVGRDRCRSWAAELRELRTAASLRAGSLTVAAGPLAVVDDDEKAARTVVDACTAWYLTAMGDAYPRLVAEQGFADEVAAIAAANPRPVPTGIVPAAAQALVDTFCAFGTAARVRSAVERWDAAADIVLVGLPPGLPWPRIEATLRAAAPARMDRTK